MFLEENDEVGPWIDNLRFRREERPQKHIHNFHIKDENKKDHCHDCERNPARRSSLL